LSAMQAWPLLNIDMGSVAANASATGASSRRIAAALPPSSSVMRFIDGAQAAATARPPVVLPVNTTRSIPGWATSAAPNAASPGSTFTRRGGTPAAAAASATTNASRGVSGAGLKIPGHPLATAGAIFAADDSNGPLKGTIAATTPTG